MNCKLLIIDNTTSIKNPWKQILTNNFSTSEAVGGFEAVTKLRGDVYDAVIVNISLDHLNGVDAVRKIREKFYFIPIIVLYKANDLLNLKQAKAYGVQSAVQDPVNVKQLIIALSKVLPAKKLQEKPNTALPKAQDSVPEVKEDYLNIEEKFYEGLSAIAASHFERAIDIYKIILNTTNIKHEAWLRYVNESFFQLGQCYAHLKDYNTSNNCYTKFISKDPQHNFVKEALLFMGKNHQSLKDFTKAGYYYKKVLNMRPMDSCTTQARKLLTQLNQHLSPERV